MDRCRGLLGSRVGCAQPVLPGTLLCQQHTDQELDNLVNPIPVWEKRICSYIKDDGTRCPVQATSGMNVCVYHAPAELRKYGGTVEADHVGAHPVTGYLWELRRTVNNILACEDEIAQLSPDTIIWGTTKIEDKVAAVSYGPDGKPFDGSYRLTVEESRLNMWVRLYGQERDRYTQLVKIGIAAGFEERRIALEEHDVRSLQTVITNVLTRAGLDPASPELRSTIREELLEIERVGAAS